jgi:hypothetical protein
MPTIVNDLDVIAEPPQKAPAQPPKQQNTPPPGPTPDDLYWVVRRQALRRLRLHAD